VLVGKELHMIPTWIAWCAFFFGVGVGMLVAAVWIGSGG
jgi:hypothetical protein